MKLIRYDDELFMNHVPGAIAIDMAGMVTYVNKQCCEYLQRDRSEVIHKHILEAFPDTRMLENLETLEHPELVFYSSYVGIGISVHVPLFDGDIRVGLLEFDATQGSKRLYELSKEYSEFLDKELMHVADDMDMPGDAKYSINRIIGRSLPIISLKEDILNAAQSNSTVIITGETGTGKELVANAIHNLSERRKYKMVSVNSSAFPENLVESELFGYEEGSFTGAVKGGKKGKFEVADKGTLFIDEINQMPLFVQPKLLRVLQEKEVDKIGSTSSIPVDVRIIAATNQNLQDLVAEGKFREDLFYRLNVIPIHLPPLRDRLDDLELLMEGKIKDLNPVLGKRVTKIDEAVIHNFRQYDWPGNVRELHNRVERAMNYVPADEDTLKLEHFGIEEGPEKTDFAKLREMENPIEDIKQEAERKLIMDVLEKVGGNKTKAAEYLKIQRPLLYQKMNRLGIK